MKLEINVNAPETVCKGTAVVEKLLVEPVRESYIEEQQSANVSCCLGRDNQGETHLKLFT